MGGTLNFFWTTPEENTTSAHGKVTPHSGNAHRADNATTPPAVWTRTAIFVGFDPQMQFGVSLRKFKVGNK
jgi:phospholipase C